MYTTYILKSINHNRYYIGSTSNIHARLERHNQGRSKWTKTYKPWKLVYREDFSDKGASLRREREIKSYKGGEAFKKLINNSNL